MIRFKQLSVLGELSLWKFSGIDCTYLDVRRAASADLEPLDCILYGEEEGACPGHEVVRLLSMEARLFQMHI